MAEKENNQEKTGLHKVLTHPIRRAILEALRVEGTSSPVRFSRSTKGSHNEIDLNLASYHFRVLAKYDVIELSTKIRRRGSEEHIYRINPESAVPDLLHATELLQRLMSEHGSVAVDGERITLDTIEHGITIIPIDVDLEGRLEAARMIADIQADLREIAEASRRRLADKREEEGVSIRIGIAIYSPKPDGTEPPK